MIIISYLLMDGKKMRNRQCHWDFGRENNIRFINTAFVLWWNGHCSKLMVLAAWMAQCWLTDIKVNCLIYELSFQNKDIDADLLAKEVAIETVDTIVMTILKASIHLLLIPASCDQWHSSQVKIRNGHFCRCRTNWGQVAANHY